MKILFVGKKFRADMLGIGCLAAVLKKAGHQVDLVQDDVDNADKYLTVNSADFVIYSVMSNEANWVVQRNRELKANHRFLSAVGGPDPTFMPERWLEDETIDYVVQGPGESVILDIVEGLSPRFSRGTLLGQFEYIPPDRGILYKYDEFGKARMKRFIACRYCPFSCTYCFNNAFKKIYRDQKWCFTYRPAPEKIIEEIINVKKNFGLELANFNDDDLAGNPDWITEFCNLLLATGVPLNFCGSIRANSVDKKMVETMARAGCVLLIFSVESANPETQKFLRRGPITNDDIYKTACWCKEVGIKVRLQNMIGLPVEDPLADALETFEFSKMCQPTDSLAAIYQPLPGTELCLYCIKKDLLNGDIQPRGLYEKTVLKIKDAEKINRLGKYWHWAVKENWPIEHLRKRLEEPMSDEVMETMTQARFAASKKELFGL